MNYKFPQIQEAHQRITLRFAELTQKDHILRDPIFRELYSQIKTIGDSDKAAFGAEVNQLKNEVASWVAMEGDKQEEMLTKIDVTAPWDVNTTPDLHPRLLPVENGSIHPITTELAYISNIFSRMGFEIVESRQLDDDFHMFESLNFPEGHPARDDYDTFMTSDGLIAPAHTSTMQHRVLKERVSQLESGEPIAVLIPGRVFRNEDLDATHEHTFHQFEGVYVSKGVNVGNLIATLQTFLSEYFGQTLKAKIQPFYFPFTEPSFEFAIERPDSLRKGNSEADQWLELLGCGMIHPKVLSLAGIDPEIYTGFAWGCGVERLILMKYGIDDIRYFQSAKLDFLRQFS